MPKIYFLFPILIISIGLFYTVYVNKKFSDVKKNLDTDKLYKDFIKENYSNLSEMNLIALSFSEELGDTAKNLAKLGAKKLALGAVGLKYRETQEGPIHALIAHDNEKTVVIPIYVDIMNGQIEEYPETTPFEIKDSDIGELKLSDNGLVVFKDKDGEKLVLKVTDKDFFQKDQSAAREKFIQKVQNLKGRLG